jgi:hypothetical protein
MNVALLTPDETNATLLAFAEVRQRPAGRRTNGVGKLGDRAPAQIVGAD